MRRSKYFIFFASCSGATIPGIAPRKSFSGMAFPSRFTKTKFSQVSTFTATRPFFRAVEIADAFKLDHAFQRAVDSVGPAVIRAAELLSAALRFGDHRGGMMPADVVKRAQLVVFAAGHDDGFTANV